MGTDIHFYVERKVDGKWISADKWTPDEYHEGEGEVPLHVHYKDEFYQGRNYSLFAMLADVRNGYGFAGVKTGDGFVPISEPRGFPNDASPELADLYDRHGHYNHSHSWLTLAELKAYDWNQVTRRQGVVEAVNFAIFEKEGKPKGWSGGVSGGMVRHISNDEMRELVKKHEAIITPLLDGEAMYFREPLSEVEEFSYYTTVTWEESYASCAGSFLTDTIPRLEALSYGRPENVRIVFWFDS